MYNFLAEKRAAAAAGATGSNQQMPTPQTQVQGGTKTTMSYTSAIMASGRGGGTTPVSFSGGTFAAKLSNSSTEQGGPLVSTVIANPTPVTARARSQQSNVCYVLI